MARDSTSLQELANINKDTSINILPILLALLGPAPGAGFSIGERERDPLGLFGAGVGDAELRKLGIMRTEKASVILIPLIVNVSH